MSSAQVIANYELLSALTVQMRVAAEHGKWETLISLEQQRSDMVTAMKQIDAVTKLDETAYQRKNQLINNILADEAEIRNHTEAWMKQLQELMQSNVQEQRLHHAYGPSID